MTRPSRNQDQILIDTAKKLLPKMGISGISLKQIAEQAGVNLGMFHYYFGSKKKFVHKVLEEIYEQIYANLAKKSLEGTTPVERLRSALLALAIAVRDNKKIFTSLVQDLLNSEAEVTKMVTHMMGREIEVILPLIEQAQKEGYFEPVPIRQAIAFCMSTTVVVILVAEGADRVKKGMPASVSKKLDTDLTSDESILQRIDMVMKALSVNPRRVT